MSEASVSSGNQMDPTQQSPEDDTVVVSESDRYQGVEEPFEGSPERESAPVDSAPGTSTLAKVDSNPEAKAARGKHGRHAKVAAEEPLSKKEAKRQKKQRDKQELPAYMKKSKRMRRILIVVLILLVALFAAGAYFTWQLLQEAASNAQEIIQQDTSSVIVDDDGTDATTTAVKTMTMPNLTSMLGQNVESVMTNLQRGCQITSDLPVQEEGSPIVEEVRLALTEDATDSQTGTPTVYLGLNEEALVIQAGCSASASALGYGAVSFADAVTNEHIIENTLREAGLSVDDGAVSLPEDSATYSTYAEDGTTLLREYCSFSGVSEADGCEWSAVLSYDYSMTRATANLSDTVRTVYVYISWV